MSTRKVHSRASNSRKTFKAPKNPLPENVAVMHDLFDISSTKENLKTLIEKIKIVKQILRVPPTGRRNNNMNIAFPNNKNNTGNFRYANRTNTMANTMKYMHILENILELRKDLIIQINIILSNLSKHIKEKDIDIFTPDVCKNIYSYLDFMGSIAAIIPRKKHDPKQFMLVFESAKFQKLMNTILQGGIELEQYNGFYSVFKITL